MKHFYIIANLDKDYATEARDAIAAYLESKGAECIIHIPDKEGQKDAGSNQMTEGTHISEGQVPPETECVITIGGDGTLIQAARDLAGRRIPMLGVNRGHLGFLNQVSRQQDMEPVMDALLEDRFELERRMMIQGTVMREGEPIHSDIALNEITITRKVPIKMLRYKVFVNDEYLNEYAADGVLVATPTGSTAYNLSAGGPVIAPTGRMMVLTPICPHTMNARSIVLAPEDKIRLKMLNCGQLAFFDGDTWVEMMGEDSICVESSRLETVMVKLGKVSFMQNLSNHLGGL